MVTYDFICYWSKHDTLGKHYKIDSFYFLLFDGKTFTKMDYPFIKNHRYLFHETTPWGELKQFRANFLMVIGEGDFRQILMTKIDTENSMSTILSTPYSWITTVESLDDIVIDTILPTDVLLIIDSFL